MGIASLGVVLLLTGVLLCVWAVAVGTNGRWGRCLVAFGLAAIAIITGMNLLAFGHVLGPLSTR